MWDSFPWSHGLLFTFAGFCALKSPWEQPSSTVLFLPYCAHFSVVTFCDIFVACLPSSSHSISLQEGRRLCPAGHDNSMPKAVLLLWNELVGEWIVNHTWKLPGGDRNGAEQLQPWSREGQENRNSRQGKHGVEACRTRKPGVLLQCWWPWGEVVMAVGTHESKGVAGLSLRPVSASQGRTCWHLWVTCGWWAPERTQRVMGRAESSHPRKSYAVLCIIFNL